MEKSKNGANLFCYSVFFLLSWHAVLTFTDSNTQYRTFSNTTGTNITSSGDDTNSSHLESNNDLQQRRASNYSAHIQTPPNHRRPSSNPIPDETHNSPVLNSSGSLSPTPGHSQLNVNNDDRNVTSSLNAENLETSKSSLHDWTPSENITNVNKSNLIENKTGKHNLFENRSSDYFFHDSYQGENAQDTENKKSFGATKLLALFLGMAGVLICLLIFVYCIYSRQHKEEMFSHQRLHGEGFEDPVLHLDTPVDHFDFFSFRDTNLTPAQTPQLKYHHMTTSTLAKNSKAGAPKGTTSNEHLQQIINLESLIDPTVDKNFK